MDTFSVPEDDMPDLALLEYTNAVTLRAEVDLLRWMGSLSPTATAMQSIVSGIDPEARVFGLFSLYPVLIEGWPRVRVGYRQVNFFDQSEHGFQPGFTRYAGGSIYCFGQTVGEASENQFADAATLFRLLRGADLAPAVETWHNEGGN